MSDNSPTKRRQAKPSKVRAASPFRKKNRKTVRYSDQDCADIARALARTIREQQDDVSENELLHDHSMGSIRAYLATPEAEAVPMVKSA